jgi:hypothetical protein
MMGRLFGIELVKSHIYVGKLYEGKQMGVDLE